ncbi:ethylbenzene dehydrogenase-related protein [Fundidesulfovibrio terrae]|uniref:ethylbenzene dehydrogenase-related protein n=1 Tax=Fundidesulfovibrio terrae TaxID=2922866 RepID=UPI001FAE7F9E|nr:ethylbenzene dehydrogenase-related protein [Fundidesulfovibrio terrae]
MNRSTTSFSLPVAMLALLLALTALASPPQVQAGHRVLTASRTATPPDVNIPDDPAWKAAQPVSVLDVVANIEVVLRGLHDGQNVYIQASFPCPKPSTQHRVQRWDAGRRAYVDGPEREDAIILKWSMVSHDTGLTLHEDAPYVADEWYWKAHRSDHAGYADDKIQIYSVNPQPYAKPMLSRSGKVFYLNRKGDEGQEAAETILYPGYAGERVPKFRLVTPDGSRADIRAKGVWKDGRWTVSFARKLVTGNADDVAFSLDGAYPFGVSRFEIAGREPEPGVDQPLFGCGDVGEILELRFQK